MTLTPSAYRTWRSRLAWPRLHLPGLCHACDQWTWQALCPACASLAHAPVDQHTANCLAAKLYVSPWKELITAFKFEGQAGLAYFLAQHMRLTPAIAHRLDNGDFVLPVPLSAQRLRERGFNQALLLAKQLSPQRSLAQGLIRCRETPPQSGLQRHDRLRNLQHAFIVNPAYEHALRGSQVVLVDDVITTGATLDACTQTLLATGVAAVSAVVLARTPA